MNPLAIIADVAEESVGLHEVTANRNPEFQKFWNSTEYKNGVADRAPYCSAFLSYCVQEADRRSTEIRLLIPPRFAAVADWRAWAYRRDTGCVVYRPTTEGFSPIRGDLVIFKFSHCGVVSSYLGGDVMRTTEANTSPTDAGSQRDGDGIWTKTRKLALVDYFIRLPVLAVKI